MARTRPTLPSQASATAVAAVAKVAPLHPVFPSGFSGGVPVPKLTTPQPALTALNTNASLNDTFPLNY